MIESISPGMIMIVGALLIPLVPARFRAWVALFLPLLSLAHLISLPTDLIGTIKVFSYELELVRIDKLSRIFGIIFHIAAVLAVVFALHVKSAVEHTSTLLYAGAAIAAAFVGDLISLFVFWELTAISSVFLIWARRTNRSYRAGFRYLMVQVTSGVLLLAGALIHFAETGSLEFTHIGLNGVGGYLIFFAFGIKAAFPLLHNWLQDAYPEATVTGTVVLSAFSTKLAIYALARGFAGTEILIPIGAIMTAFPIFYAVIENDLRRVLAYSLNNQLGYMVVGIGIGTELSLNGTAAHAFAHILYKALLFMSMGAVLFRTGKINASELGGLYKSMPWTMTFCMIGAASISAFPLLSGFVTKSMILTAAAEEHHTLTFLVLLFASAGVFDHSGIKIPYFTFFAHDSGMRPKEAPWNMLLAMSGAAFLCIAIGVYPEQLYALLPHPVKYQPYTVTHVITTMQLLMFAGLAFAFLNIYKIYPPELRSINLDSDWFYRRGVPRVAITMFRGARDVVGVFKQGADRMLTGWGNTAHRLLAPNGSLGEPWTAGNATTWTVATLGLVMALAFFAALGHG